MQNVNLIKGDDGMDLSIWTYYNNNKNVEQI